MNFPELCDRLIKEIGVAKVYCPKYPKLGTVGGPWILLVEENIFDVGTIDRGKWESEAKFSTESEACEVLYKHATWISPPLRARTPEEKERSRKLNEELIRSILGETPEN